MDIFRSVQPAFRYSQGAMAAEGDDHCAVDVGTEKAERLISLVKFWIRAVV